ncbi:MAG: GNAT family N-acetyltransferase [Paracoccaceae bacterium]
MTAFHRGWRPALIGRITALHAAYYAPAHGLGRVFEARVAAGLGAFFERYDPERDLTLSAWAGDELLGSVTVDGADAGAARLRWFVVAEAARGGGLGRGLLDAALAFVDRPPGRACTLTSFAGLDAARRLYERAGFRLEHEAPATSWGPTLSEQRFRRPPR